MKKNIFKKLAFVLAFAMVASTITPAASAFAASKPGFADAHSKTFLLKEEGRTMYNFNIENKVKGATYKWTSSDTKVATVNSKNGVVYAKAIGTAKITCVITLKSKTIATLVAPVTVKENIETLTIEKVTEESIAVGASYNFNIDYTTKTGHKTTDIVRFEITKGNDAKVASIAANGVFTSTVAGDFEITALSFQSEAKYAEYLKGDTTTVTATSLVAKITVVPSIVSITQKSDKIFDLAFDTAVSTLVTKENLVITNAAGVKLPIIKSVTFDTTGKIATVETYISLSDKEVYTVSYDKMSKDFTASVGAVAKIVITGPSKVADNEPLAIETKLYDANGVEVSKATIASIAFTITNNVGWVDGANITLFNIGDVSAIKATYKTGTYDTSGNEIVIESAGYSVVAVDTIVATTNKLTTWTISDYKATKSDANFTTLVQQISLNQTGKFLYVKGLDSNVKDTYDFTFTSTDTSKLIVDEKTGALITVAAGNVGVIVASGNFKTVIIINVTAESKVSAIAVDKTSAILSNAALVDAKELFTIVAKDQYGNVKDAYTPSVTSLSSPTGSTPATYFAPDDATDSAKFTFSAKNATPGTYTYKLTAAEKSVVVTIVVKAPGITATSWKLTTVNTSVDQKVNNDTANLSGYVVTVKAYSYDNAGVAIAPIAVAASDLDLKHSDGTSYPASIIATGNTGEFTITTVTSGAAVVKALKTGNFTVSGTYTVDATVKNLVPTYFALTDTQVAVTVSQEATNKEIGTTTDLYTTLNSAFKVTTNAGATTTSVVVDSDNVSTTATVSGGAIAATGTYYVLVKKLTVTETFAHYTVTRDIDVNKVITVVVK